MLIEMTVWRGAQWLALDYQQPEMENGAGEPRPFALAGSWLGPSTHSVNSPGKPLGTEVITHANTALPALGGWPACPMEGWALLYFSYRFFQCPARSISVRRSVRINTISDEVCVIT